MNRSLILGLLLALIVGTTLRCPQLAERPMHNDEAVNAIKLRALWEKGTYQYDPLEYHGPTLPYLTFGWMKLIGPKKFVDFSETQLRALTVVFGLGLIVLLPLVADGLGRQATIYAAMLTAISPAMVFYSRYYIHEMLLVFFTLLALGAGWRFSLSGKLGWALLTGAAIGLMQATKETFVLTLAAMVAALILERLWKRLFDEASTNAVKINVKYLFAALVMWIAVICILFSSFFTNAHGIWDAAITYLPWVRRAAGASPHIHPWNYYLERLAYFHTSKGPIWSEGLILLLALAGLGAAFRRKILIEGCAAFIRFIGFYTVLLTGIYCGIGYKTPWCLLSFWLGIILMAGVGAIALLDWFPKRALKITVAALLIACACQLAFQARQASIEYAADTRNPYIYGQTSPDILNLVDRVNALAEVDPQKNQMLIKVIAPDSEFWPLPWYFRRFTQVGWWPEIPTDPYAPVMIVSTRFQANFDTNGTHVMAGMFALRPQTFFELYVETNLWRTNLNAHKPVQ